MKKNSSGQEKIKEQKKEPTKTKKASGNHLPNEIVSFLIIEFCKSKGRTERKESV